MPSNLAEAMIKLLDHSSNEGLAILSQALSKGEHVLGNLWADQLTQQVALDLQTVQTVLPGIDSQFRTAQPSERAQFPTTVDPQLLEGTTINFSRSLVRLAWMLQHAVTILPMAGDIQAALNSQTAGVSDIHAWGLMLPSALSKPCHVSLGGRGQIPGSLPVHQQCLGIRKLCLRWTPVQTPRFPIRTMGHQCQNQRFGRGRSRDARVTSAF